MQIHRPDPRSQCGREISGMMAEVAVSNTGDGLLSGCRTQHYLPPWLPEGPP
jgi:hypothetical protein